MTQRSTQYWFHRILDFWRFGHFLEAHSWQHFLEGDFTSSGCPNSLSEIVHRSVVGVIGFLGFLCHLRKLSAPCIRRKSFGREKELSGSFDKALKLVAGKISTKRLNSVFFCYQCYVDRAESFPNSLFMGSVVIALPKTREEKGVLCWWLWITVSFVSVIGWRLHCHWNRRQIQPAWQVNHLCLLDFIGLRSKMLCNSAWKLERQGYERYCTRDGFVAEATRCLKSDWVRPAQAALALAMNIRRKWPAYLLFSNHNNCLHPTDPRAVGAWAGIHSNSWAYSVEHVFFFFWLPDAMDGAHTGTGFGFISAKW